DVDSIVASGTRLDALLGGSAPVSLLDKIKMLPRLKELADLFPVSVRKAACQEVVEKDRPSLLALPVIKCWPKDAGRYITLPLVFTHDPASGKRNCGIYRMQVFDATPAARH